MPAPAKFGQELGRLARRGGRDEIRLRDDPHEAALPVDDQHAANLSPLHHGEDFLDGRVFANRLHYFGQHDSAVWPDGFFPSATTRQTMSRSVSTPTGRSK